MIVFYAMMTASNGCAEGASLGCFKGMHGAGAMMLCP